MFSPLSTTPRIPVGLEITITQDLEVLYDKHFYLLIPRAHFTTNPNALLAMVSPSESYTLHSPINTLTTSTTTILTNPLNPKSILGEFNAELEFTTHGNRAQDTATHRLLDIFKNAGPGPLKNGFPHHKTLPHCFTVLATGEHPDDD